MAELHPLNDLLERGTTYWQIDLGRGAGAMSSDNRNPSLRRVRSFTTPHQLLQPVAEAIADLVCNEDFRLICACEENACGRLFLDRVKLHGRPLCCAKFCDLCLKVAADRRSCRHTT